jgi:hypothetical protein
MDRRLRLAWAASGLLPLVFLAVGGFALSDQPAATDSVESVRSYIASHWVAIHMHHTFIGLCFVAALWFAVLLSRVLREAEGQPGSISTLALSGAALAVAVELVVIALHSATFVEAGNTVQLRSTLTAVIRELVILELFLWATFFAAAAIVAIRTRSLPAWLGWTAAAVALIDLVVGVYSGLTGVNAAATSGPFGPALVMVYVTTLWFAAAGVVLIRRELKA